MLAVTQLLVTILVIAAVVVPGAALLRLSRRGTDAAAQPELDRAAGILLGLGWATVCSAATLAIGLPRVSFVVLLAVPVAAWAVLAWRTRRAVRRAADDAAGDTRAGAPVRGRIALHAWAATIAVLVGIRGASYISDAAFHAALVEKLIRLPTTSFESVGLFADGSINPSTYVPAWHHLLAAAGMFMPTASAGALAVWSASGAVAWLVVMVAAASGRALAGTGFGAGAAAVFVPAVLFVPWSGVDQHLLRTVGYPGNVVLFVVLPAIMALLVDVACRSDHADALKRWRWALVGGVFALAALHATYAYYLAVVGIGMLVAAVVFDRAVARRLAHAAAYVVVAGVVGVGLQLPVLLGHGEFNRGTGGDTGDTIRTMWMRVIEDDSFAIRSEWFLAMGVPYTIGLLVSVLVLAVWVRRRMQPSSAAMRFLLLVAVPTLVLGVAARSGAVGEFVAGIGSFPPLPRSPRVVPAALGLVAGAVLLSDVLVARRDRLDARRGGLLAAVVVAPFVGWALIGPSSGMGNDLGFVLDPVLPGWVFDLILVLTALLLVAGAIRSRAGAGARGTSTSDAPTDARAARRAEARLARPAPAAFAVVALVALGATATFVARSLPAIDERPTRVEYARGLVDGDVVVYETIAMLRRLPPRTIVMSDPRLSMRLAALAPVYITMTDKQNLSSEERYERSHMWIDQPSGTDDERRAFLREEDVDVAFLRGRPAYSNSLRRVASESGDWGELQSGTRNWLYCLDPCEALEGIAKLPLRRVRPPED